MYVLVKHAAQKEHWKWERLQCVAEWQDCRMLDLLSITVEVLNIHTKKKINSLAVSPLIPLLSQTLAPQTIAQFIYFFYSLLMLLLFWYLFYTSRLFIHNNVVYWLFPKYLLCCTFLPSFFSVKLFFFLTSRVLS